MPTRRFWIDLFWLIFLLMAGYLILIVHSQYVSNQLLFQPPIKATYVDGKDILKLISLNGKKISAIYLPNAKAKYTIIYSHGNATDLGGIYPILQDFYLQGYSVISYDYQGYGTSEGWPSEKNTYDDIEAVYNYLVYFLKIPPENIIVFGNSLGGAVSTHLAKKRKTAALILQSTFISTFKVLTFVPFIPFDKYNSLKNIEQVKEPVLIIHGKLDDTIPFWHAEELFKHANSPKFYYWVLNASHDDLNIKAGQQYWQVIHKFIAGLTANPNNRRKVVPGIR